MVEEIIRPGYTRVSEIIRDPEKYKNVDPVIVAAKGEIGTNVHKAIYEYEEGLPVCLPDDEGGQYFRSYLVWRAEKNFATVKAELRLYDDELMITGAIDALVRFPGQDELILCDWKTTYAADTYAWPLQAGFYRYLLEKNGVEGVSNTILFVKLDKIGEQPRIFEYEYTADLFEDCKAAHRMYHHRKRAHPRTKSQNEDFDA